MTSEMREYRFDPMQRRWIIIASGREERPREQGLAAATLTARATDCGFCPGNEEQTPPAIHTVNSESGDWLLRVVPNKYPAVTPAVTGVTLPPRAPEGYPRSSRLEGHGLHEVIIETPRHHSPLSRREPDEIELLLRVYRQRIRALRREPDIAYVQVFRNEGPLAGASIVHPHSQVLALTVPPATIEIELAASLAHHEARRRCLLCEIIEEEIATGTRILFADEDVVSFCPYASRLPFEVCLAPRCHRHDFADSDDLELRQLARHLGRVSGRIDAVLGSPSFNLVLHTSPSLREDDRGAASAPARAYHWHAELLPRLNPVGGFEWATGVYLNSVAPEDAAASLLRATV